MKYKHIIWDYNGTILDDTQMVLDILNIMLKRRDMQTKTIEEYREIFDFPIYDYYKRVGFNFDIDSFDDLANEFMTLYDAALPDCRLRKGILDFMDHLNCEDYKQSILTAGREKNVVKEVEDFGVNKYIKKITGLHNNKAESKVILAAKHLEKINTDAADILFIGDTTHDKIVANEIGCDCVLLAGGHQSVRRLKEVNDMVACDLDDIKQYL